MTTSEYCDGLAMHPPRSTTPVLSRFELGYEAERPSTRRLQHCGEGPMGSAGHEVPHGRVVRTGAGIHVERTGRSGFDLGISQFGSSLEAIGPFVHDIEETLSLPDVLTSKVRVVIVGAGTAGPRGGGRRPNGW